MSHAFNKRFPKPATNAAATQSSKYICKNNLSEHDKNTILQDFPKIELSYETAVHNKVQSNYMAAIPQGKKYFAWFTVYNEQNVCLLLEISAHCKQILNISPVYTAFDSSLCFGGFGTIVYGTCIYYKQTQFFSLEDLFYYKGRNVCGDYHINKLYIFKHMLQQDLGQYAFNTQCLIFGLPFIHNDYSILVKTIAELPYKIYSVKCYNLNKTEIFTFRYSDFLNFGNIEALQPSILPYKKQSVNIAHSNNNHINNIHNIHKTASTNSNSNSNNIKLNKMQIFKVTADIQPDVYHLHSTSSEFIAYIPNYNTSVMMNKLFRNIKENANLDALEESDDEEEFENSQVDKFVFLDKTYNMECIYNHKFKKWVPQKVV